MLLSLNIKNKYIKLSVLGGGNNNICDFYGITNKTRDKTKSRTSVYEICGPNN